MANILVVDDEPGIRTAVGQALREAGYGVRTAANGAEALELMRERTPDGVVLDLNMPVMDGCTFLSTCRAEPAYAEVGVALFTTRSTETLAANLDVQAYISKPFDLDDLTAAVSRLLERPWPGARRTSPHAGGIVAGRHGRIASRDLSMGRDSCACSTGRAPAAN